MQNGGFGIDNALVNIVFLVTIIALVAYLTITRKDVTDMRSAT